MIGKAGMIYMIIYPVNHTGFAIMFILSLFLKRRASGPLRLLCRLTWDLLGDQAVGIDRFLSRQDRIEGNFHVNHPIFLPLLSFFCPLSKESVRSPNFFWLPSWNLNDPRLKRKRLGGHIESRQFLPRNRFFQHLFFNFGKRPIGESFSLHLLKRGHLETKISNRLNNQRYCAKNH